MKSLKYNDFEIRFTKEESDLRAAKYDLCITDTWIVNAFEKSRNQIIFNSNEKNIHLGNFQKYILAKKGVNGFNLIWTSFKGNPEIYDIKSDSSFFDYLFLSFVKKKQKVLYAGENVNAAIASWRNSVNLDLFTNKFDIDSIISEFLKKTQETYLPF